MEIENRVIVVGDKVNFKQGTELDGKILKINKETLIIEGHGEVPISKCYLGTGKTITEKKERKNHLKNKPTAQTGNKKVTIGDKVWFKCDTEQEGNVSEIKTENGVVMLVLTNEAGFEGGYIGGDVKVDEEASRCWVV